MKKLLKVKSLSNLTTTICVCLLSLSVYAGSGTGTHDFGLDITQNESCELAKLKATKNLIENELGVVIQVNDIKTCVNDNCHLNSFKWIMYPAILKSAKFETQIINADNRRYCKATVEGEVLSLDDHYHEDHDFSVTLNKKGNYYVNDYVKMNIHGLSDLYYHVYDVNKDIERLYPNSMHDSIKTDHLIIPNSNYNLRVAKNENPNSLLVVISSPKPFHMLPSYNMKDFVELLLSMKLEGFRLRVYNYTVQ